MNLYIEIQNGVAQNHPAFEDNLIQAFGSIPPNWQPFMRVEQPVLTTYQILESNVSVYTKVNDVWIDVWSVRDMTADEINAKQQSEKDRWATLPDRDNFSAWTFDETTCKYKAPTPKPTEGKFFWQGTTLTWVSRPAYPTDNKTYKLDFASATWIEVTP